MSSTTEVSTDEQAKAILAPVVKYICGCGSTPECPREAEVRKVVAAALAEQAATIERLTKAADLPSEADGLRTILEARDRTIERLRSALASNDPMPIVPDWVVEKAKLTAKLQAAREKIGRMRLAVKNYLGTLRISEWTDIEQELEDAVTEHEE